MNKFDKNKKPSFPGQDIEDLSDSAIAQNIKKTIEDSPHADYEITEEDQENYEARS